MSIKNNKTYVIADIGINHNGDLDVVRRLIELAATSGFDAVKFQKRNPEKIPDHMKDVHRSTPWGEMTYLEYKHKVEFGLEDYKLIDEWCKYNRIEWSASPWDMDSVCFLVDHFNLPWLKIASAVNNNKEIIQACAGSNKNIILSTGMSDSTDVERMLSWIDRSINDVTLLHCNSSYPAPLRDLNLRCIPSMIKKYPDCRIGYSGHEFGLTTSIATVALGAKVVERHITLDRTMWGSDQMCSVEPHGMIKLVRGIRDLECALGASKKFVTEGEFLKVNSLR